MMLDDGLNLPQDVRDAAYNNTAAVKDSHLQLASFEARSADFATRVPGELDIRFGVAERLVFDYFPGGGAKAPTLLFIHGGYWQMRHKNTFRFVVEGALKHGLNAALIGYTLAPQATLTTIVDEVRQGIHAIRTHALARNGSPDVLLCGWSAGGHLTAMAMSCDGVVAGLGISGIYDLEPIRHTYLNRALQLTDAEVQTLSPLRLPVIHKPFITAFGTAELPQLQAQSQLFAKHRSDAAGELHPVVDANHFSILTSLSDPSGSLLKKFMEISC